MAEKYICPNCGRFMKEKMKKSWFDYHIEYECDCGVNSDSLEYTTNTTPIPDYLDNLLDNKRG